MKDIKSLFNETKTRVLSINLKLDKMAKDIEDFIIAQLKLRDKVFINPKTRFYFWNGRHYSLSGIRIIEENKLILYFKYGCEGDETHLTIRDLPLKDILKFLEWFECYVILKDDFGNWC